MASAFSHAFVALVLGKASRHPIMTWQVLFLGMACSIVPDLDVIGFSFGIRYGDLWGHRGLTHSIFFACLLSALLVRVWYWRTSSSAKATLFIYFFSCTASHGVLDAMTNGGLGVAFFSPFDTSRYFFTYRPVAVSPIGIGDFFTGEAFRILASEATWIWLPTLVLFLLLRGFQQMWLWRPSQTSHRPREPGESAKD
ncbi:MAG: metal-dependent hydrolase [Nitrospira sp.]|nr:metal-dependent hydrolase [Nitrospira sp.]